ncbi:MAG TPA: hypothetical protein VFM02_02305 [Candidatus Paceibacterota bacterium]|nr:hypothetical protein [Candidatus Paceibacterota bacterium]
MAFSIFLNLLLFIFSAAILWIISGLLIEAVDKVAARLHRSGFTVAFFVLGFLTSVSEISVMISSTLGHVPQVSVGNLIGGSFVVLLFIVPVLAIVGNGVRLKDTLSKPQLMAALFVILLPALFTLNGTIHAREGWICLLAYAALLYFIRKGKWWWQKKSDSAPEVFEEVGEELVSKRHATEIDVFKIIGGAIIIFFASSLLVHETVYFSGLLHVPSSLIGLLVISIGTNMPELVIAVRSVQKAKISIAFGDYFGSAVTNSLIFGFLAIFNGPFPVERASFFFPAGLMTIGFVLFYFFANTKNDISRKEGVVLVSVYAIFVLSQIGTFIWFAAR